MSSEGRHFSPEAPGILQADRLDPLKESPPSVIDRKTETVSYTSYYGYGYQKPDPPFRFPKPIWRMK